MSTEKQKSNSSNIGGGIFIVLILFGLWGIDGLTSGNGFFGGIHDSLAALGFLLAIAVIIYIIYRINSD